MVAVGVAVALEGAADGFPVSTVGVKEGESVGAMVLTVGERDEHSVFV